MSTDTSAKDSTPVGRAERAMDHPSPAERVAAGRRAREAVPRESHDGWKPRPDRRDPVELLEEQAATRVPELVPIRYGRMLTSPFAFYRGAALLMAADLADTPRTGLKVQLCGDAHLSNFGAFAAPDRRLVFSVNDFDDTLPGPFEWDLKRLVASCAVAARAVGQSAAEREVLTLAVGRKYREAMSAFAHMRAFDIWYARLDAEQFRREWEAGASRGEKKRFERTVAKSRTKDSMKAFGKLTRRVDGEPRMISDPPLIVPIDELLGPDDAQAFVDAVRAIIRSYRHSLPADRRLLLERFRYVDCARKVVGVGSVGTRAWVVLMVGNDGDDPLFLQIKEAEASVLERFLAKSMFANHGQRVVEGQRLMQSASDVMLGWFRSPGLDGVSRDFYIRQLWDGKISAVIESMSRRGLRAYAEICASTLAAAHARSGDPVAIAAYLGRGDAFDGALASFAESYADQNERDFAALRAAVDAGRITAHTGV
jgi:uncharacterized protein (DUF2252 family)